MPGRRSVPLDGSAAPVALSLRIDGDDSPAIQHVVEVRVSREIGGLPEARVVLRLDATGLSTPVDPYPMGAEVDIGVGSASDRTRLFRGVVTGKTLSADMSGLSLTLVCRHTLYRAALAPKVRVWHDARDADCIAQVLANHGVAIEGAPYGAVHRVRWQWEATDWAFARALAEANGWLLLATDDDVSLRAPDVSQAPVATLVYGDTILAFEGESDACLQPSRVQISAWTPADQQVSVVEGDEPAIPHARTSAAALAAVHGQVLTSRHAGDIDAAELQQLASAALQARRLAEPRGRVSCIGIASPMPGTWVRLQGLGQGFDGDVLVSGVTHAIGANGWTTEVRFGRPVGAAATADVRVRPGMADGLQIGIVEALDDDPRGEDRLRVRLPLADGAGPGIHARLAVPDAGPNRGMVFRPEIGDEVVIACLGGDPRHAVILGALHGSAHPAPIAPDGDNPVKGYVSRRGMKLLFDDANGTLRLETAAGRALVLSDDTATLRIEDPHGNCIVMDAGGIAIESAGSLSLKAGGDLRLQGVRVKMEAGATLDLSGNAGAKLSTDAGLTLRGSLVMIN